MDRITLTNQLNEYFTSIDRGYFIKLGGYREVAPGTDMWVCQAVFNGQLPFQCVVIPGPATVVLMDYRTMVYIFGRPREEGA